MLVDFWTYTCINWLRTLAYVRAWAEKYADQGLVVVGVHTPEFAVRARHRQRRAAAAKDMRVDYPIALDTDYAVWQAFANHYWPAVYIADAEGRIRHHHFGEGGYDGVRDGHPASAARGRARGRRRRSRRRSRRTGSRRRPTGTNLESPETLPRLRAGPELRLAGAAPRSTSLASYAAPEPLGLNHWALAGEWTIESGGVRARTSPDGRHRVSLPRPRRQPRPASGAHGAARCRSACSSTASRPVPRTGSTSTSRATARSIEPAALPAGPAARIDHRPHVRDRRSSSPGVEAYVFTFG